MTKKHSGLVLKHNRKGRPSLIFGKSFKFVPERGQPHSAPGVAHIPGVAAKQFIK